MYLYHENGQGTGSQRTKATRHSCASILRLNFMYLKIVKAQEASPQRQRLIPAPARD